MTRRLTAATAVAVILTGCAHLTGTPQRSPTRSGPVPGPTGGHQTAATAPVRHFWLGVYVPGVPASYTPVGKFAAAVGRHPDVVAYYSGWYEKFQLAFANAAERHGAAPIIQINPGGVRLGDIAAGRYDVFLRAYAAAVRDFGHPVIIGFGHEMNGGWYPWGWQHAPAATFVAAWRHIHDVFAAEGADKVIWLWTVIIANPADTGPLRSWWPGERYVNMVGIDGYYVYPSDTFGNVFGSTITAVRGFTRDPVLIAETGAAPGAGQVAKIADLFRGIRAHGVLGFVYFDQTNHASAGYHQDWRLAGNAAALAEFRRLAAALRLWRP